MAHDRLVLKLISPHWGGPTLAGKNTVVEHDPDHIDQLNLGLDHQGNVLLQQFHLYILPPVEALPEP